MILSQNWRRAEYKNQTMGAETLEKFFMIREQRTERVA